LRETTAAWGFLAPSALHLAVFSLVPILFACYLSVHRWSLIEPVRPFVGLDNYARLLRDPLVWAALRNTVLYVLYVPVSAALALAVALALRGRSRGVRALRTAFFLPSVASAVAVALVWQWIYRPEGDGHCRDRKSTRLNSSHDQISYAGFCLIQKNGDTARRR